jgi:hypothetical protein
MSDLRTAAQQALEALMIAEAALADIGDADRELSDDVAWCEERAARALAAPRAAITALRAALAQPEPRNQCGETCERAKLCAVCARGLAQQEQEPVTDLRCAFWLDPECADAGACQSLKFKANPPRREWQGLTEEDIWTLAAKHMDTVLGRLHFARAIEQALRSKNHE